MNFLKIFILLYLFTQFLYANKLVMGYREDERKPLIEKKGDNSGLYMELYSLAAKKIGYELEIIRKPKKRILLEMKQGKIDFYPGFTFTVPRSKDVYFIENGLPGGDVGISLKDFPEVKSFNDLSGKKVLVATGGPNETRLSSIDHIRLHRVPRLSINKAISLIVLKRDDFYIYNKSSINYYIKMNEIDYLKVHENCCGGFKPMYLGFSKNSPKFKEIKNPNYDDSKNLSIGNLPTKLDTESVAYKFYNALMEMKNDGTTERLYNKYYK